LRRFRLSVLRRLLRLIRTHRIEVVHWNFYPPLTNGYLWSLTCLTPRVRHYLTDHNSRILPLDRSSFALIRLFKRLLLRRYERTVGVIKFVVDCLQQQGTWSNVACRMHFVNTQRFRPDQSIRAELRQRLNAGERFVLLTVSNLIHEKGVAVLLKALRDLPDDALLWVVGEGAEAEPLSALASRAGVAGRVRFLGLQSEVAPYMQAADCFICPSLWAEAAGLVCIEAQACALPVIASNVGGIPEYVADGATGHLFPAGDTSQLVDRVRRLLDDPAGRLRMGEQARRRILERFSAEARLDDFLDLYRCPAEPAIPERKGETCPRR
jgi:glycosyltransferase involved in cell wall biosynthesis